MADPIIFSCSTAATTPIETEFRDKYLQTLIDLSLADLETSLDSLENHRSHIPAGSPLPLLGCRKSLGDPYVREAGKIYDRFALGARANFFVESEIGEEDLIAFDNGKKHYGKVIHRLEYSDIDKESNDGGRDILPQYVFQLGRLIIPSKLFTTKMLPFLAVVDILDPQKAVWLIHIVDINDDPEELEPCYPDPDDLRQLQCLFDNDIFHSASQRVPAYHMSQLAPSLEEWMALDYDTMISNIEKTRRRGTLRMRLAWPDDFRAAIDKARLGARRDRASSSGTEASSDTEASSVLDASDSKASSDPKDSV